MGTKAVQSLLHIELFVGFCGGSVEKQFAQIACILPVFLALPNEIVQFAKPLRSDVALHKVAYQVVDMLVFCFHSRFPFIMIEPFGVVVG